MKTRFLVGLVLFTWFARWSGAEGAGLELGRDIDIPYTKFVLKNGLTLIVHEDHKAPIVAVNVWYHVGSKNEKPGKTGFAHLFEHLMFNGSEHFDDDYFKAMEKVGATESQRHHQRGPHQLLRERAQGRARFPALAGVRPHGPPARRDRPRPSSMSSAAWCRTKNARAKTSPTAMTRELITKGTCPPGHPYSWTVIGSMEDLNAASLDDVKEWFKTYYGAANATLVVAGDVKPARRAAQKVEKYFGDIPPGPPVARHEAWVAKRTGTHAQIAQDRVPQARLYKVWNIPQYGTAEADYLDLVSDVLASGKTSRLYKRLVYDEQIATRRLRLCRRSAKSPASSCIVATARPGRYLATDRERPSTRNWPGSSKGPTRRGAGAGQDRKPWPGSSAASNASAGSAANPTSWRSNRSSPATPDYYKTMLSGSARPRPKLLRDTAREWLTDGVTSWKSIRSPTTRRPSPTWTAPSCPCPTLKPEVKLPGLRAHQPCQWTEDRARRNAARSRW